MRPAILLLAAALLQQPAVKPASPEALAVERLATLATTAERQQAIDTEPIAMTPAMLEAVNARAIVVLNAHDFAGAEAWLQLALGYAEQKKDARAVALTLRNLSEVARQVNEYDKALDYQRSSLTWSRLAGDARLTASGLANTAAILRRLGDEDEAVAAAREGLAAADALKDPVIQSASHTTLANALAQMGDFRGALEHYTQSVQINRAIGNRGNEAIALCNSGDVYRAQGDVALAIDTFLRCIPMAEKVGFTITQARFTGSLADAYLLAGEREKAHQAGEQALALGQRLNHREIIAGACNTLAAIAWEENRQADAIAAIEESIRTLESISNKDILSSVLPLLGFYQARMGHTEQALATLERSRALAREVGDRVSLYHASTEAGKTLRAIGRTADAKAAFDEAIRAAEGVRDDVAGTVAQTGFFADKLDPYHEMVAIAADGNAVNEAFRFAERGRTQALLGVLRGGRVSVTKAMTAVERSEESRLRQQMAAANIAFIAATEKGPATTAATARLDKSRTAYTEFERRLYAAHPELKSARLDVTPATPAEAAATLPDDKTALLEFVVSPEKTFLFVVSKEGTPQLYTIPIGAERLAKLVDQLAGKVAARALDYRALARELERLLIEPAGSALLRATTLVIVPDGPLWRLPFAVLESKAGVPLIERHALFETPSVTVLREVQARRRTRSSRTLLAVGNPPGAGLATADAGLGALADLYGTANARVLTGAAATESTFKAQAGRYDIVQLASHGVLDDANPLYSYVTLAKSAGDDGFLEAREMAELDLHADLVVLSACETARGRVSGGEGLIGMTWALFLAGSPATVASEWKVDEVATSKLMLALHQHLRKGESRASALRAAMLEIRSDPPFRHPFYWAAFVLSGDGF